MNRACLVALGLSCAAFAQDGDEALRRGVGAVAAISGEIGGGPVLGAGILFAREKDRLYPAPRTRSYFTIATGTGPYFGHCRSSSAPLG